MQCRKMEVQKLSKVIHLVMGSKYPQFHTTVTQSSQIGRAMKKVLGSTAPKKKHKYTEAPIMPSTNTFSKGVHEGKRSSNSRRASVLNKLFMRYITDLMASGENATEFLGHGIEISNVQVSPDYKFLQVFWVGKGDTGDEIIENILDKNAGPLRHELTQLRLIGQVPNLRFVKDERQASIAEVDRRLAKADFGPDHVPIEPTMKLKVELELTTSLDEKTKEKLLELDTLKDECNDVPLPEMPQNVLGLNHADILSRIKKVMKKSEALHRSDATTSSTAGDINRSINDDPITFGDGKTQRQIFREFLHSRQVLRAKASKEEKNYIPDVEYIKEEIRNKYLSQMDVIPEIQILDNDYILEDESK